MNRITRGENVLNRLVDRGTLSSEGKSAFIAALDPFHDNRITDLCGWPDLNTAPSVVRTLNYSTTVRCLADGGSIVVWTNPFFLTKDVGNINNTLAQYNRAGNCLTAKTVNNYGVASTMVMQFPDALDWRFAAASQYNTSLAPDDSFLNGSSRVIGWGLEVHDVSAELYKQGTLTVFGVPQSEVVPETYYTAAAAGGTATAAVSSHLYHRWPNSLNEALLYPDTRQWDAQQGCYTVIPCMGPDNPAAAPQYTQPSLPLNATLADQIGGINDGLDIFLPPYKLSGARLYWDPAKLVPYHSRGVALTGLSVNSVFTVNVKYYIETFPALDDKTIMTMARPSAPHDPVALELISRAVQQLPLGVPVGDNPGGEWFMDVLGKVLPMLGTGLSALTGLPLAGAGTLLGGLASNKAEEWRKAKQQSKAQNMALTQAAVSKVLRERGDPFPNPQARLKRDRDRKKTAMKRNRAANPAKGVK